MDQKIKDLILDILAKGKDLTLATIRPDGYPHATTVSYANDGLTIYVGVGKESQKVHNVRECNKVSLTVNTDYPDWNHIKGISVGAIAEILDEPAEIMRAVSCMTRRFPQIADFAQSKDAGEFVMLKITPQIISVLDYEKGFGHTDLVKV
jgi:general stress protein 26